MHINTTKWINGQVQWSKIVWVFWPNYKSHTNTLVCVCNTTPTSTTFDKYIYFIAFSHSTTVNCTIMQKNGAGLHTASSCFWNNDTDGSCTVSNQRNGNHSINQLIIHLLHLSFQVRWENKTMYCIVSVYGLAIWSHLANDSKSFPILLMINFASEIFSNYSLSIAH